MNLTLPVGVSEVSAGVASPATLSRTLESPCYVYDPERVHVGFGRLRAMLGTGLVVSLKANPDPDLYARCAHVFTDGVEVASLRELGVVTGSRIPRFVNNPSMKADLVRAGLLTRSTFIVDHIDQAELIVAQAHGRKVEPVLLRLNARGIGHGEARADHFGMTLDQAIEAATRLGDAGVAVRGIHVFAGSNSFLRCAGAMVDVVRQAAGVLEARLGLRLSTLNLGGGFPIDWERDGATLSRYASGLAPLRERYEVLHESGRGIFGRAGLFIVSVVAVKRRANGWVVICDGGLAQNLLATGITSPIRRRSTPLTPARGDRIPSDLPVTFVGSSCSQDDVIGEAEAGVPLPRPGDRLMFRDSGAYHQTFAAVDFLGLPKARTYIGPLSQVWGDAP